MLAAKQMPSMRYVRQLLVFRLQRRPTAAAMVSVNQDFADIMVDGDYELTSALPAEDDDPELSSLPRLAFQFDRRNHRRLRQLVDFLNTCPVE